MTYLYAAKAPVVLLALTGSVALGPLTAAAPPPPPSAAMTPSRLPTALCLAGMPALVFANSSIDTTGKRWVINFGSTAAGRPGFCIDEDHCGMVAASCPGPNPDCPPPAAGQPSPAPAPPAPVPLTGAGIQSQNCTENPEFCMFNHAQLDDCDQALLLSSAELVTVCRNVSDQLRPINGSACTLHFHGLRIIEESLVLLAGLGLKNAEQVVLTGFSHGGTMALLHADRVHAQLKTIAPSLKTVATLPADGIHPRSRWGVVDWFPQICCAPFCNSSRVCSNTLDLLYAGMANVSNASAALAPECRARQPPGEEWRCLYTNASTPHVETPAFLVNQMASVFDTQCNLAGSIIDMGQGFAAVLQLKCITGEGPWHECFQYSDKCSGGPDGQVLGVIAPFQQQYIDETRAFVAKKGNGAFLHSCHNGGYFYNAYQKPDNGSITFPKTSIWNQWAVGGVTMQQAIGAWWKRLQQSEEVSIDTAAVSWDGDSDGLTDVTVDCVWSEPPGRGTWTNDTARNNWGMSYCNPTCDGFPYY
eukprot:SAG31_NODE_174_length_21353_cov_23.387974_16_plen_531_part_00